MDFDKEEIRLQIEKLAQKYAQTGQNLSANLEGLLYADYLKYWDYIQVDSLLSLQKPRTHFPDEMIFIVYHQITELYFKMILWEMEQIAAQEPLEAAFFVERLARINRYMEMLAQSFEIMIQGMDIEQFRQFRMSLLPASGFQSAQFRMIEICATDFRNLVEKSYRPQLDHNSSFEEMYEYIYWKKGATEEETQKKTITLEHFEQRYSDAFLKLAKEYQNKNLWQQYRKIQPDDALQADLVKAMRYFDYQVNVRWAHAHLKAAASYLKPKGQPIAATGGTNWTKYLPPNLQKRIFYPKLWSAEEIEAWGRTEWKE